MNEIFLIKKTGIMVFFGLLFFSSSIYASSTVKVHGIPTDEIVGYNEYPSIVKKIINQSLDLTQKKLTYLYGSADPQRGGMDCSGTIYFLLKLNKLTNVPRSSSEIYKWVVNKGKFYPVTASNISSKDFSHLKPGDLLFWVGTYKTKHNPPISHVMLYLGTNKQNQPLMFGSSDGRTYQGKQMGGVSVFDFKLPNAGSSARFIGYSCIPNLTC
jgi:NlpC/P60 family